jgi:hypothetical protein
VRKVGETIVMESADADGVRARLPQTMVPQLVDAYMRWCCGTIEKKPGEA